MFDELQTTNRERERGRKGHQQVVMTHFEPLLDELRVNNGMRS